MRTAPIVIAAVATALAACGSAPPPAPTPTAPSTAQRAPEQRLPSGLRWVVERVPGAPAVAVQLWLPSGAVHDPADGPGTAALAALTAGMRLDGALAAVGGQAEGWARADATALSISVAPERLPEALKTLARIIDSPPGEADTRAARARFASQIIAAGRSPERRALQRLLALAWGTHPAARPLVGVEAPPADAVESWRAAHHRPAGAVLVVAGDIAPTAKTLADSLGGWSGRPPASTLAAPSLPPKGPLVQVDERSGDRAAIRLAWPVPMGDPEAAARADVLASTLVTGPDAPVPAALARAEVDARAAAFVHAPGPDGVLIVTVDSPAAHIDAAWRALAEAMAHARRHPPSRALIARVVDGLESARARATADPEALASYVGPRALRWPGAGDRWLEAAAAVTPDALAPLARTLRPRAMIAWLGTPIPEGLDGDLWGERLAEGFTAEKAPAALAGGFPGLTAQVVSRPGSGVVALSVRTSGGSATVPSDMLGAAHLAASALAAPMPGLGRPAVELSPDALSVTLTVPVERFPEAAGALLDRLLRPIWTGARVETARAEALARLNDGDVHAAAETLLRGDLARSGGAPSAEPEAVQAGLETVPPARVAAWFDGYVSHGPMRVVAVGDLDEAGLYRALAAGVPAERPGVRMQPLRPPPSAVAAPAGVHRVDRRIEGERAGWAVGWAVGEVSDDRLAAIEVALALIVRGAELDAGPLSVEPIVDSRAEHSRVGLVISGPVGAVREAVPRVFAALSERAQIAARPDATTAAVRWLEGRRTVRLAAAAALAGWIATQADAGRTFVGSGALTQWKAAIERARGGQTLSAVRDHLKLGGRFEVWIGAGAPPETPDAPPAQAGTEESP